MSPTKTYQRRVNRQKRSEDIVKTFGEHLAELRSRLVWIVLWLIGGMFAGYLLKDKLIELLLISHPEPLFYSSPTGGLDFVIKICLIFGLIVTIPMIMFQTIKFLVPIIPESYKLEIWKYLGGSLVLMILGILFAYTTTLPAAIRFLDGFNTDQIKSLISTTEYLSFVSTYLLGFGVAFQLPLIMMIANLVHKLEIKKLMSYQKYVIAGSFLISAVLTPTPDIVNQTFMAVPIIVLYQISVGLIWWKNRKRANSIVR